MIGSWSVDRFLLVHLPRATIRHIHRTTYEPCHCTVEASDALELVTVTFRRCRELRGEGARIVWVEFVTDGITRRRYVDGRTSGPRLTRTMLDTDSWDRNTHPS